MKLDKNKNIDQEFAKREGNYGKLWSELVKKDK